MVPFTRVDGEKPERSAVIHSGEAALGAWFQCQDGIPLKPRYQRPGRMAIPRRATFGCSLQRGALPPGQRREWWA